MHRVLTYSKPVIGIRLPNISSMCSLDGVDMTVVHVSHRTALTYTSPRTVRSQACFSAAIY